MKEVPVLSLREAVKLVKDGDLLLQGGFGMTGNPVHLMHALAETDTKNLTFIGNNTGEPGLGGDRLLANGQLKKVIGSFFTSNPNAVKAVQAGLIEAELLPQGTLAEAIRAGGAGIGGFYTKTSAGTKIAEGRETKIIDGEEQVFIKGIRGNVAFIRAWRADAAGNLQYRMTENNFNKAMATAADLVIAEVEEIVAVGEIAPENVHTQGCFVDYLVQAKLTLEDLGTSASVASSKKVDDLRMNMARRALAELKKGDVCCVIIEGIQGVGGLDEGTTQFFQDLEKICAQYEVILILDEVQSGYGRTGKFFAHQHHIIKADIICLAKGMGNGFPIGGILIAPKFKASYGLLGTTFGGSHLACAAGIAVLDVIKGQKLMDNVNEVYAYFLNAIKQIPEVKKVKGKGLMLGIEFDFEINELRKKMIIDKHIFTGNANNKNLLRILPPLTINAKGIDTFIIALKEALQEIQS
jgi:3-oxoacid CoA-transferase A subunit